MSSARENGVDRAPAGAKSSRSAIFLTKAIDDALDVLRTIAANDEDSVTGFHDDDIVEADSGYESVSRSDIGIGARLQQNVTLHMVAMFVARREVMQRRPRSYVAPSGR